MRTGRNLPCGNADGMAVKGSTLGRKKRAPGEPAVPAGEAPFTPIRGGVALLLGVAFIGLAGELVRRAELVTGRYLSAGVPPILAVGALVLLAAFRAVLLRSAHPLARRLAPDRRQMLLVFAMACIGVVLNGQYTVRAFLPHAVSLQYWQSRSPALARWAEYLPEWYAPADVAAIRAYFEGARGAGVPWHLWLFPLLRWSVLFVALFAVAAALMVLLRRQWLHHERLSFPLLYLPLSLTAGEQGGLFGWRGLLRHPLLALGLAVAACWNGINIAHALHPAVPATGFVYSFADRFPNEPWTPFNTVRLYFMLDSIGFGYFIPLEVSFSAWFFYLAIKLAAVAGIAMGYQAPRFPYMQDQCAGAYLGVAALVLYGARKHLLGIVRRAFAPGARPESREEREERLALFVFLGGIATVLGWVHLAGFSLVVAAPFFAILLAFVLVYARIRAETGAPFEFVYPYGLAKDMLVNALTPRGILDAGGPRTWVVFSSLAWLSRHHSMQAMAAYTVDGLKLAEEGRVERRWLCAALALAVVAGLAVSFRAHLEAFYAVGANLAGGGKMEYRATVALQEYQQMATLATTAAPRDTARLGAQLFGAAAAVSLGVTRLLFVRSPFHPLGYILATAYGDHNTMFFPMLVAWTLKSAILRIGGLPLYRQGIPFFIGLILGHFLIGGIFWPLFSLTLAPEASQSYHLYFGG